MDETSRTKISKVWHTAKLLHYGMVEVAPTVFRTKEEAEIDIRANIQAGEQWVILEGFKHIPIFSEEIDKQIEQFRDVGGLNKWMEKNQQELEH